MYSRRADELSAGLFTCILDQMLNEIPSPIPHERTINSITA